jgi:hypothetical protein
MAITKPLKPEDKGAGFIAKAADTRPERWQRGNKTQITLSIAPDLLAQVDDAARRRHLSRAALLTVWIGDALQREAA